MIRAIAESYRRGASAVQRTCDSAAWPATRNGSALATRQPSGPVRRTGVAARCVNGYVTLGTASLVVPQARDSRDYDRPEQQNKTGTRKRKRPAGHMAGNVLDKREDNDDRPSQATDAEKDGVASVIQVVSGMSLVLLRFGAWRNAVRLRMGRDQPSNQVPSLRWHEGFAELCIDTDATSPLLIERFRVGVRKNDDERRELRFGLQELAQFVSRNSGQCRGCDDDRWLDSRRLLPGLMTIGDRDYGAAPLLKQDTEDIPHRKAFLRDQYRVSGE